nr:HAMP domain-containing sensor histidine kinase [Candidatus Sigynarchaeota archaeon]
MSDQIAFLVLHFVLYGIPALLIAKFKSEKASFFYAYFGFMYVFTQLFAILYSIQVTSDLTITGGNIAYSSLILITIIIFFMKHDAIVVRNLIVIQVILNIFLYFLYLLLTAILLDPESINILHVDPSLFSTTIAINIISSCVFVVEVLLMFFSLEKVKKVIKNMALLVTVNILVYAGILCLDGFLFPFLVMFFEPVFGQFIVGGVIGKLIISAGFAPFLILFFLIFKKDYYEYLATTISIKSMLMPTREKLLQQLSETTTKLVQSEKNYLAAYKEAKLYKDMFTHDISNIIQVILMNLKLYEQAGAAIIDKTFEAIRSQVNKAMSLIENVRKSSAVEEKLVGLDVKDVNQVLKAVIAKINDEFKDKVEVKIISSPDSVKVRANDLLNDIFYNIISNGIKYNNSPIPSIEIAVSIGKSVHVNDTVKIEFIDNGIGIPDDRKKLIFTDGQQDKKSGKGMGMALALIVKALEIFGGNIHVEDRVSGDHSRGSRFIIKIPRFES